MLKNVASALGIPTETLLARAGLIENDDDDSPPSTEEAIRRDPHLSAEEKQALLGVYRSYRAAKG